MLYKKKLYCMQQLKHVIRNVLLFLCYLRISKFINTHKDTAMIKILPVMCVHAYVRLRGVEPWPGTEAIGILTHVVGPHHYGYSNV